MGSKRWCWWVNETQDATDGFIPSIVTESEPGHTPMAGNPETHTAPYIWGATIEEARRTVDRANADLGITPDEARKIVTSSMWPSR